MARAPGNTRTTLRQRHALPSVLPAALRRLLVATLALALFMAANTLYLLLNRLADALDWNVFARGATALPKLFQAMVLSHTGVGLVLAALVLIFVIVHLPHVWQRRHTDSVVSGAAYLTVGLILVLTGLFILTAAASGEHRWVWWTHVAAAGLAPAGYVLHRLASYARPPSRAFRRFAVAAVAALVVLLAAHTVGDRGIVRTPEAQVARDQGHGAGPGAERRDVARHADPGLVPAAFVPPQSPFFPSAATTASGWYAPSRIVTLGEGGTPEALERDLARYGFVVETRIGAETCARCHQDIVAQWEASAHRFSSFNNPFYEATVGDLRDNATESNEWIDAHIAQFPDAAGAAGRVKSQWCAGCHDPALLFAGVMSREIDRSTADAQAGLTCLSCHAIDVVHGRTGNGAYNIRDEQEDPYLFATAPAGTVRGWLHDAVLKAKPTVHLRRMLTPAFRESTYCAACHKVSLPAAVNNYRWLRGQDEFDNWDDSGISLNASRTFYLPDSVRTCQGCHMPPKPAPLGDVSAQDGVVRSHRFLAVNTALPFVRGDSGTIARIENFLRDEKLSVDIFAVAAGGSPVMAADRQPPVLTTGRQVTVDVVVRNRGVGHTFPGGTNDSNEGWLEFSVLDERGTRIAVSGSVADDGHLDPMAHVYKAVMLDGDGNPIQRRNAQDIRVTVFANTIGPGTADVAHYVFTVPRELAGQTLTVRARLLWRKFNRAYTEFAFETNRQGFRRFDDVPDLPVTEIAADELRLAVAPATPGAAPAGAGAGAGAGADAASDWMRYNDYGIALLLEGDTRGAAVAFERVAALRPDRIDGPLNVAKAALRDGNVARVYEYLRRSETIAPADARAAWVWGVALQEEGRYQQAVEAYRRVLERFPDDRAAWRNLGRTYYLNGQYEQALNAFARVLQIDPEDRVAHYHRMLCYRALGRNEEAELAAAAAEYYSIDESAQDITRAFRLRNPGANLMAQQIRTHVLTLKP